MIISVRENVYPAEVENALASHPAVADVAVIGVPSARWGETVKALVVPMPRHRSVRRGADRARARRIARYKCPTSVDFVAELPRNASGKVLKRVLRAPYWPGGNGSVDRGTTSTAGAWHDERIGRRRAAARDEGGEEYQQRRAEIVRAAAGIFKQTASARRS